MYIIKKTGRQLLPVLLLLSAVTTFAQETPPGPPFQNLPPDLQTEQSFRLENNLRDTYYVVTHNSQDVFLSKEQWQQEQGASKEKLSISMYNYREKLFVGVYNPLLLHYDVPNCEKINITIKNATIAETGKNQYRVIVGNEKHVEIKVWGTMKNGTSQLIGEKTFDVVQLPDRLKRAILTDAGLPLENSKEAIVPNPEVRPKYKEDLQEMMSAAFHSAKALKKEAQGTVTARFTITTGGFVKDVQLDESSPSKDADLFEELKRLLYLSSGRWFPAMDKGLLVSTIHTVTVNFTAQNGVSGITVQ